MYSFRVSFVQSSEGESTQKRKRLAHFACRLASLPARCCPPRLPRCNDAARCYPPGACRRPHRHGTPGERAARAGKENAGGHVGRSLSLASLARCRRAWRRGPCPPRRASPCRPPELSVSAVPRRSFCALSPTASHPRFFSLLFSVLSLSCRVCVCVCVCAQRGMASLPAQTERMPGVKPTVAGARVPSDLKVPAAGR